MTRKFPIHKLQTTNKLQYQIFLNYKHEILVIGILELFVICVLEFVICPKKQIVAGLYYNLLTFA